MDPPYPLRAKTWPPTRKNACVNCELEVKRKILNFETDCHIFIKSYASRQTVSENIKFDFD